MNVSLGFVCVNKFKIIKINIMLSKKNSRILTKCYQNVNNKLILRIKT